MAHLKTQQELEDELIKAKKSVQIGCRYSHYKKPQNIYKVIDVAVQEATDKICVIYQAEYMNHVLFVRNLDSWLEKPVVDGKQVERFTPVSFVAPNDPVLIKIAKTIPESKILSPTIQKNIEKLLDVAFGHRIDHTKPTVVGLAAPQIGMSLRIIAVDIGADGKGGISNLQVFINPEIIQHSKEEEEWCEGCWSTDRVCGVVSRAKRITIQAFTIEGKKVIEKHHGYVARIFQHEIDHLNGHEFVNRITDDDKLHWVKESEWVDYKQKEGWRNWPHKCPRLKWRKIKGITD